MILESNQYDLYMQRLFKIWEYTFTIVDNY
jgi:hypothetical protein